MRIIAGTHRGRALTPVGGGDAAAHLRPTSDRVRESIFNLLVNGGHGDLVEGATVLDLFAGTGALGLEALSRGAAHVTFVDQGRVARSILHRNIELLRAESETRVLEQDATRIAPNTGKTATLTFLDPPYGKGLGEAALKAALRGGWLAPEAMIVWEEGSPPTPPMGFALVDRRKYGDTHVTLLQAPA
ncbi:MAG: 16S rRNA (guanine(966)-N(2))-methyltransferase RsmD [Cereibacter sphaeroides]|uniref:16S rRNA (Guanine(966)-N(2))-methyltransferase RsmD n=1 Tax=Cereibacter sphaeroides TaxID=1063 RepID=A0A2W5U3D4_CERSP|nr:MAG: 16S rRNA (guanine(966)-N(2))-methyltransferase RsmD [Cereibacter sphaeroides]